MSAKPVSLLFFCQNKAENAGRPGEGRVDVTLALMRPSHLADKTKPIDPNPGVCEQHGGASLQFGDVTEVFAANFARGKKYKLTIEESE